MLASFTDGLVEIVCFCFSLKYWLAARSREFGSSDLPGEALFEVFCDGPGTSMENTGGGVLAAAVFVSAVFEDFLI